MTQTWTRRLLGLLLLALLPASAEAQTHSTMTVAQLQQLCSSRYDIDVGMCAGYISAIAESLMQNNNPQERVCLSPAIGPQILIEHMQAAWQKNPPQPQDFANANVEHVLRTRFRCP